MKKIGLLVLVLLMTSNFTATTCMADEMLEDFESRIVDFKLKISSKGFDVEMAQIHKYSSDKEEFLELAYRGYVPRDVENKKIRNEDELKKAKADFDSLEGEIKALKTEILKYYKGKTPKELKEHIENLLLSYSQKRLDVANQEGELLADVKKFMNDLLNKAHK